MYHLTPKDKTAVAEIVNQCALSFTEEDVPMSQDGGAIIARFLEGTYRQGAEAREGDLHRARAEGYIDGMAAANGPSIRTLEEWIATATPRDLAPALVRLVELLDEQTAVVADLQAHLAAYEADRDPEEAE